MDLNVKVVPKSSKAGVAGALADGTLKVKVTSAPEKGKANQEVREVLAQHFGVPVHNVQILSGETSPRKRVRILGPS
jgi:uncharacterized protein (TIGR00251 family)